MIIQDLKAQELKDNIEVYNWKEVAALATQAKRLKKEFEEKEKILLDQLKKLSNDETHQEGEYRFLRYEVKGTVDYSAIDVLKEMDLEPFRKPSRLQWKLEIVNI